MNCTGPHRRLNPLTGAYVLCSPQRITRPWQGEVSEPQLDVRPAYDEACYLCPRNRRATGAVNPDYTGTHAFTNDFAALLPDSVDSCLQQQQQQHADDEEDAEEEEAEQLFAALPERGTCRVLCFSPRHDLTLAEMQVEEIHAVVRAWVQQYRELIQLPYVHHVQIFENKGQMMGCSNPHPHGQVWATEHVPTEIERELHRMHSYRQQHGGQHHLLLDYAERELQRKERLVYANDSFLVVVPFWAAWPFETLVLPRHTPFASLLHLSDAQCYHLADALHQITTRYDNLFQCSFPYSMGIHQQPALPSTDALHEAAQSSVLHLHFYPPLLRSASIRKFMVGYEMLAESGRDITAESAAERLRQVPAVHYRLRT